MSPGKSKTTACSACTVAELTAASKETNLEFQWLQLPGIPDAAVGIERLCNAAKDVSKMLPVLAEESEGLMNESHDKVLESVKVCSACVVFIGWRRVRRVVEHSLISSACPPSSSL